MRIIGGEERMDDQYDAQVYSVSSGWLTPDRDYVESIVFSPVLIPFVAWLQEIVRDLLADPNYQEDF